MELVKDKWDEKSYAEFTDFLLQNIKPGAAEFGAKLIKTKYKILGVSTPAMKTIVEQIPKGNFDSFIKLTKTDYYEQVGAMGQVIVACACDIATRKKYLTRYIALIDNWALCDGVVMYFKILEKQRAEYYDFLKDLLGGDTYSVRFALCCFMYYYLTDEYIDEVLKFVDEVTDKDYYVMMMQAWLIATAFVKHRKKTLAFLGNNNLDKITQNKAIQKMRESRQVSAEDKQMILAFKKK